MKKIDGAIFKVPLAEPDRVSQVKVDGAFVGGDGLVVVANATPDMTTTMVR